MFIKLFKSDNLEPAKVQLPGSKSESNRALILNALSGDQSSLLGLSTARDTQTLRSLLNNEEIRQNVHDAGTVMRFLTAFYAVSGKNRILSGSNRMSERPIGNLVDALVKIGAQIRYLGKKGFPPIETLGFETQRANEVSISGEVSSQFLSALLMVAPILPEGLSVRILGEVISRPYIQMTLSIMKQFGIESIWTDEVIQVRHQSIQKGTFHVSPDWSAASYIYSLVALSENGRIYIHDLAEDSLQGDRKVVDYMKLMGVSTEFQPGGIDLSKSSSSINVEINFRETPDLVQTIAVLCVAKNIPAVFKGLDSLRIKETDRINALQTELSKINGELVETVPGTFHVKTLGPLPPSVKIDTYQDHRMAMAFAPLCMLMEVEIEDPDIVNKSFPEFWNQIQKLGLAVSPPID